MDKARGDQSLWEALDAYALTLEPGLRRAFLSQLRAARSRASIRRLAGFIRNGDTTGLVQYILDLVGGLEALRDSLTQALVASGQFTAAHMPGSLLVSFNAYNPAVVAAVNLETLRLIRQITTGLRESIVESLSESLIEGIGPEAAARRIRGEIGLTVKQRRAVANFRRMLQAGDPQVLRRELRDRRYDRTLLQVLQGKRTLTADEIERMTERYYERYLIYRSNNIARTESIRALHNGGRLAWEEVFERGLMQRDEVVRFWIVAPLEGPSSHRTTRAIGGSKGSGKLVRRTCEICAEVPHMNKGGNAFDKPFETPIGFVMGPPLHPHCRCVVVTRFKFLGTFGMNPLPGRAA